MLKSESKSSLSFTGPRLSSHRIKETLRKEFADLANDLSQHLHAISVELSNVEGELEVCDPLVVLGPCPFTSCYKDQKGYVGAFQTRLPAFEDALARVSRAEADCVAANVEENDYTIFTCQDLEFELELLRQSIAKKISFIDNQVLLHLLHSVCAVRSD